MSEGWKFITLVVYYISNLKLDAEKFASGIRGHWGIENRLHYVKDVVFKEDNSPISQINAATNFSIITTIAINILRSQGRTSITKAIRQVGNSWGGWGHFTLFNGYTDNFILSAPTHG